MRFFPSPISCGTSVSFSSYLIAMCLCVEGSQKGVNLDLFMELNIGVVCKMLEETDAIPKFPDDPT